MLSFPRRCGGRFARRLTCFAVAAAIGAPGFAAAQIGEDLAPDPTEVTDLIDDVESVLPTPLPSETPDQKQIPDPVGDVLDDVGDLGSLDGGGGGDTGGQDGGDEGGGGGGDGGRTTGGDQSTGGQSGTPQDGGGALTTGSPGDPSSEANDPSSDDGSTGAVLQPAVSYGGAARRGAIVAAGRALRLAGPLAPPLALAGIAVVMLVALGRGRGRGLVKGSRDEVSGTRTYRL